MSFPSKKYKLILADPPWAYENKNTGGSLDSGACQKYDTMSIDEIKQLPVKSIAMEDSCIFMWAVTPLLQEAFDKNLPVYPTREDGQAILEFIKKGLGKK